MNFCLLLKIWVKLLVKSETLNGKCSQKLLDHSKQSATDPPKTTLERAIQKAAEATGDLIVNKIADKITKVSKNSSQNNSGTVTNEHDKEVPKERYIFPEEREKFIDDLKLI